jgi:hypothetical protein
LIHPDDFLLERSRPQPAGPSEPALEKQAADLNPRQRLDELLEALTTAGKSVKRTTIDWVGRFVAVSRLSVQEQSLVAADEFNDLGHASVGDLLRSEPQCLALQGARHERTHRPGAAEILVRLDHERLDPVGDDPEGAPPCERHLDVIAGTDQAGDRSGAQPGRSARRPLVNPTASHRDDRPILVKPPKAAGQAGLELIIRLLNSQQKSPF